MWDELLAIPTKTVEKTFGDTVTSTGQDTWANIEYQMDPKYFQPHLWYARTYPEHYAGCSRVVYMDRKRGYVYKVAMNRMGAMANEREALEYQEGCPHVPMAPCELLGSGVLRMVIVEMFTLEELKALENNHTWIRNEVESAQVGLYNGDIVVYDWGTWGRDES